MFVENTQKVPRVKKRLNTTGQHIYDVLNFEHLRVYILCVLVTTFILDVVYLNPFNLMSVYVCETDDDECKRNEFCSGYYTASRGVL